MRYEKCAPISKVVEISNVTVSVHYLIGGNGIITDLPLPINGEESKAPHKSALRIKDYIDKLSLV